MANDLKEREVNIEMKLRDKSPIKPVSEVKVEKRIKQEVLVEVSDKNEVEKTIIKKHMHMMKKETEILRDESSLIKVIKQSSNDDYPVEKYVARLEEVTEEKLEMYKQMRDMLVAYKMRNKVKSKR